MHAPDGAVTGGITRGDANDHNDIYPSGPQDVAGVVVGALTGRAAAAYALWRTIPVQVAAAVLMVLLWPASTNRRRRTRPTTHRTRADPNTPERDEAGRAGAAGATRRQVRQVATALSWQRPAPSRQPSALKPGGREDSLRT